ncbi:DUF4352 domain-containing protein [Halorientalis marina]|uniref:DUF4352 domain-containing protein n=1 Tax=Halorientalis marina TaxID=2931976 RepID=UPI001FF55EE0|nr:DUF4352 domain-containing protein [Halorientalis marina]
MSVNVKTVIEWALGVLMTLLGLVLLIAPPLGIPILLGGLFLLPPVRRRVTIEIPVGWLAAWATGLLLLVIGGLAMVRVPVGGLLALLGAAVAIPPLRRRLTEQLDVDPGRAVVAGVVLLAAVSAVSVFALQQDELFDQTAVTHDVTERFVVTTEGSEVEMTVTDVATTRYLWINSSRQEPADRGRYLVVTTRVTNVDEDPATLNGLDLAVVADGGNASYNPSPRTGEIEGDRRYPAPGFVSGDQAIHVPPGETVNRTLIFDVPAGRTYLFTILPSGQNAYEDRHYVRLGRVSADDSE